MRLTSQFNDKEASYGGRLKYTVALFFLIIASNVIIHKYKSFLESRAHPNNAPQLKAKKKMNKYFNCSQKMPIKIKITIKKIQKLVEIS